MNISRSCHVPALFLVICGEFVCNAPAKLVRIPGIKRKNQVELLYLPLCKEIKQLPHFNVCKWCILIIYLKIFHDLHKKAGLWYEAIINAFPPAPLPPIIFHWYIHWYISMTGAWFHWCGAHSWKAWFSSHGGITQSKGWLCQKWKLSDIMGTHLHLATQLSKLG